MECDAEGHVCELELIQIPQTQAQIPITAAKKPSASVVSVKPATPKAVAASVSRPAAHADAAKAQKQLKSLLFIAEQYLGKTLTKTDMDAITYFYDHLGMSADLIEYLIESCVENGHKSIHYIQKVALSLSLIHIWSSKAGAAQISRSPPSKDVSPFGIIVSCPRNSSTTKTPGGISISFSVFPANG